MKEQHRSDARRKPPTYQASRGELFSFQDFKAEVTKNITNIIRDPGSADSAAVSDLKHLSRAEAKGAAERAFARLQLNEERVHEDSK